YLAARGLSWFGPPIAVPMALALAMFEAHVGGTSVAAYARQQAPAFRLLDDMRAAEAGRPERPVLATDRRQSFDLRRPLIWVGDAGPKFSTSLSAPPQHEWLELVKYWNSGGRDPVWLVVDPKRAQVELVEHARPAAYRWPLPDPVLIGGVRPSEMDWYRLD